MSNVIPIATTPRERSYDERYSDALHGLDIYSITATEQRIHVSLAGFDLYFTAESECCDSSWFVLSDIDSPDFSPQGDWLRNPNHRAKFLGYELISPREIGMVTSKELDHEGSVTYAIKVKTSRGDYLARMANDHGDSGYYSGQVSTSLTSGDLEHLREKPNG